MAFQWTTDLSATNAISRGPSLPKETDRCNRAYNALKQKATTTQGPDRAKYMHQLDELRMSIETRIEQLEDFYLQHDSDHKAILFEKQRLMLRRLLHSDSSRNAPSMQSQSLQTTSAPPPLPPASSGRAVMQTPMGASTPGGVDGMSGQEINVRLITGKNIRLGVDPRDTIRMVKEKLEREEGIPMDQQRIYFDDNGPRLVKDSQQLGAFPNGAILQLSRPAPKLAYSKNKSPRDKFAASVHKKRTEDRRRVAPIYDWEKNSNSAPRMERKYMLEQPFEFQIVLTEKEFFKLTSRRRAIRAEKKHTERNAAGSTKESPFLQSTFLHSTGPYVDPTKKDEPISHRPFLQSTGPYVDPVRISSSIYRSPNKSKWIDPRGLRPYTHL